MRFNLQRTSPRSQNDTEEYLQKSRRKSYAPKKTEHQFSLHPCGSSPATISGSHVVFTASPFPATRMAQLWKLQVAQLVLHLNCYRFQPQPSCRDGGRDVSLWMCSVGRAVRREEGLGFSFCSKCRAQETTAHVSLKPSGRKHAQTLCQSS